VTIRTPALAALIAATMGAAVAGAQAQAPALEDVLRRLDAYLARYEAILATVVAEERYSQTLQHQPSPLLDRAPRGVGQSRVLLSDYALARAPGGQAWTGFRDTYEVDGRPARDREDRLAALLAEGSATSARQALRITRENARYNLGEDIVSRTINVPTVALDLIHERHRSRFAFEKRGEEVIDGTRAWVISYTERSRPTLLRTPAGKDRRARGAVWVDPATGAVLRTDLSWDGTPPGIIVVHYRRDANIGALVPGTMLEEYRAARATLTAQATYTKYRRFQTAGRLVTPPAR
jgi:hypothetical protein